MTKSITVTALEYRANVYARVRYAAGCDGAGRQWRVKMVAAAAGEGVLSPDRDRA